MTAAYPLGTSSAEHSRLQRQADFYGPLTERLLRGAGLLPGMRILDLGCGVGDVTLLAARLVGPQGTVVGIDRDPPVLAVARARASAAHLRHVRFEVADVTAPPSGLYDAVIGRLVLMYQPDVPAVLRRLARNVAPGGLLVFQEMMMSLARSVPPVPLVEKALAVLLETFRRAGAETDLGAALHRHFLTAGLPAPNMHLEGRVEAREDSGVFQLLSDVLRSLLPISDKLGTSARALDLDTLTVRMRDQSAAARSVLMPPPLVGAWVRL